MISIDGSKFVRLAEKSDVPFKNGETVTISVIKRLVGDKWAVGIAGRVIPVFSEIALTPGQKMKAQVIRQADKTMLKLIKQDSLRISDFLVKNNLPDDVLSRIIVAGMLKTGIALSAAFIQKMRQALGKLNKEPEKFARLLSILHNKKIDISSQGIDSLFALLRYGEDQGSGGRRQKKEQGKDHHPSNEAGEISKQLKKNALSRGADSSGLSGSRHNNLLNIFNHLNGENENWVVLPYDFSSETNTIKGTIRILYHAHTGKIGKMTLCVNQDNGVCWYFHIIEQNGLKYLRIFCNDEEKRTISAREIGKLAVNLQNTGIKIDDNIYKGEDFDGFTPLEEAEQYREINILY